ncbi:signal recognition particle, SRP19 subunit [Xylogone sp. PMI_703]|nr:signal recognition particle, SRP19 subunit [Xylogone sp. PMI_703]
MSHARIEEVEDSDLESDPSEGDIDDLEFDERDILKQRTGPRPSQVQPPTAANASPSLINPSTIPSKSTQITTASDGTQFHTTEDDSKYKDFQCVYPIYFDANRTRAEGRRVGLEQAVPNPLAREIVAACGRLRLETLFEPAKTHPKDWANPGRIKIKIKGGNNSAIKNKHHLYTLISNHLKANPTTEEVAIRVRVPGVPPPDPKKPYPKPAVPKGWKMGTILPYYSPALTGGGISDNIFKDMMAEMQGQIPGMPPGAAEAFAGSSGPAEGKKKKEKKKGKA